MLPLRPTTWSPAEGDTVLVARLIAEPPVRLADASPELPDPSWTGVYSISIRKPGDTAPLGQAMYVGSGWCRDRLTRHLAKLAGRRGGNEAQVEVRWIRTTDLTSARQGEDFLVALLSPR